MNSKSIVLIGMSNAGKSFWREKLSQAGLKPFCCDDRIESKLKSYLIKKGYRGIEDVARWMGQPYEPESQRNQALYLTKEISVMKEAIRKIRKSKKPLVVDTTGSVIYTGDKILAELRKLATVVMLDAPEKLQKKLYRDYLSNPKPVIWGEIFRPRKGESRRKSLALCYPLLLKSRSKKYRKLAHVVLDYEETHSPDFTAQKFLEKIKSRTKHGI